MPDSEDEEGDSEGCVGRPSSPASDYDKQPPEIAYRSQRGRPSPQLGVDVVCYLAARFPARMEEARELSQTNDAPYGPGYRDYCRIRLINGAFVKLGLGTGPSEPKSVNVRFRGRMITITTQDVMNTFGMLQSAYDSKRSRINLMYGVYLWLDENPHAWPYAKPGTVERHFYDTMAAFFGPERLPKRGDDPSQRRPPHIRDATTLAIEKFYRTAQVIHAELGMPKKLPALPRVRE